MTRARLLLPLCFGLASLGGLCTPAEVQRTREMYDEKHQRLLAHLPRESWRVVWQSYYGERMRIWLERDATVGGIPCHGQVELFAGRVAEATLSGPHREGRFELPPRSKLRFGHPGGAPGLLNVELGADTLLDGVPCAAREPKGAAAETRFDPSGALLWCTLAAPLPQSPGCVPGALATFSAEGVTCATR